MSDVGGGEFLPLVHLAQIKLQLAVFNRIGWQLIGAHLNVAPLEAFANIPNLIAAGAPHGEVIELPLGFAQPLAAQPFVGGLPVAIGAGEVELANLELGEL